jgi:outer membrane protein OmpA-like peptidoglycan-associated protein
MKSRLAPAWLLLAWLALPAAAQPAASPSAAAPSAAAPPAIAQPTGNATANDLVDRLAPPAATTRGLRNLVPEPRSVDLVVLFDFDSARIQPASLPLLDSLATAMRSDRLVTLRFLVEGHTDAKGNAAYNQKLSQRRAESVIGHLASAGIERTRLTAEGRGAADLLLKDQPYSLENRRVRITAMP